MGIFPHKKMGWQLETAATPEYGWEPMFVSDGVTAVRRPVPGASPDLGVVRGECDIAVPAKHVLEVLRDVTRKGGTAFFFF
jgi:hypothetical protein